MRWRTTGLTGPLSRTSRWPVKRSTRLGPTSFRSSTAPMHLHSSPISPSSRLPGYGVSVLPFSIQTSNRWQVDIVQPLFTGFGLESQYKASKVGLKISQYQLEEARLNLVRGTFGSRTSRRSLGQNLLRLPVTMWQAWKCRKRTPRPITSRGSPLKTTCSKPMSPWLRRCSGREAPSNS